MQFHERYLIQALDPCAYTILDKSGTGLCYILMVTTAYGYHHNAQITIAEVANEGQGQPNFVEFSQETFAFKFFASNWQQVVALVTQILTQLNLGLDVDNPAELAAIFGGELKGAITNWPSYNPKELH